MAIQTGISDNIAGLTFEYDDVTGDVASITLDCTDPAITKIPAALALNADRAELVETALFDELIAQLSDKQTDLDCPVWADTANTVFESQGIVDRDSGQTDANGAPITETQIFKRTSILQYYKFSPSTNFSPSNAVNDND
ncbi:hypothetical protein [Picosynechococcus sp. PCC 8807]|uniref:hypothetical protein n=1 Tax=Picosynechococcus sp. PCC 8807 TaxID=195248 RepID=UPI000810C58A|nr:hypothetical protein [Picosynechococcus sp. PCC 8807]ANV92025.1 hypothetical protein AWQ24_14695 [Picosynechococcus sp. PCC 8807]